MILRIIDKKTKLFLRDDFTFDEETEIGLDVQPSQGLLTTPKWKDKGVSGADGLPSYEQGEWVESGVPYVNEL